MHYPPAQVAPLPARVSGVGCVFAIPLRALFGVANSVDRRSSSTAAMYPRRRTLVAAIRQAIFGFVSAVSACFALIGGCGSDCRRHNHAGMLRKSRAFVPRY